MIHRCSGACSMLLSSNSNNLPQPSPKSLHRTAVSANRKNVDKAVSAARRSWEKTERRPHATAILQSHIENVTESTFLRSMGGIFVGWSLLIGFYLLWKFRWRKKPAPKGTF